MKRETNFFIYLGFFLIITFFIIPFLFMLLISITQNPDFLTNFSKFNFTEKNFVSVISTPSLHFVEYLRNSTIIALISTILCLLIVILASYALVRLEIPNKTFILFFVLTISMFPQISLIGYLFKFMNYLGWINTYQALIFPYIAWTLPLALWILVSYFSKIPRELDEAAVLDGCTKWQIIKKIIFPLAVPGIFSTALLVFISTFNEFMFALMLTSDHRSRTIPVGIAMFEGLHGEIPWGNIMSASIFSILPILILVIIFQQNIIQGLTHGAVKG